LPKIKTTPAQNKALPASPIGVFDSGIGGLSVLDEITKQLPHEEVIYFADTARLPYGSKSKEEIIQFNKEIIRFLIDQGAKLVLMACGTSSSLAYPVLKDDYPVELVDLIGPGAEAALQTSQNKKIGLLATLATVNSNAYPNLISDLDKSAKVFSMACPLFVPLIEKGLTESSELRKIAKTYLVPLLEEGIDTLIMGCTHYPHIKRLLKNLAGDHVELVDPAQAAVTLAKQMLKSAGTLRNISSHGKYRYFSTGSPNQFEEIGTRLFGRPIVGTKKINL
jgi:glutamate racemase